MTALVEPMEIMERNSLPPRTLSVLIVEDSPSDVYMVENMLKDVTPELYLYTVDTPRLIDAFKIIEKEKFDVILLDLNLLDIQGVASVAALHAQLPETPIIVYSGMDDPKLHKESLLCGAQYYCVKGKETGYSLKHMIESALAAKEQENEL